MGRFVTAVIVALVCLFYSTPRAQALPVFAHRYGLSCQTCHTTVPHLNAFGEAFAANGFRLPELRHGSVPIAVKVNLAYDSDPDATGLPKAIVDEVELLTGGAIGSHFNYFLEQYAVDGGQPGLPRDAWLQYNNGAAHVRAGEFTLPLPVDPETQRDTLSHYLVYDRTVGNNAFAFFDPRIGFDAYANGSHGLEAHALALESYDRQSGTPIDGVDVMGSVSQTFSSGITASVYRYQGQRRLGGAPDPFYRQGCSLQYEHANLEITGVAQQGNDADDGEGVPVRSSGGFLQTRYAFSPALAALVRYDRAWDRSAGATQQTVLTLVTRPRRNMRFTVEDTITDHHALGLGLLFAY